MEIVEKKQDDIVVFELKGSLDSNTSPAFEERILETIKNGTSKLVVDFEAVDYISSAGLRVLNLASKKLKHNQGKIVLCAVEDYIREVFEIAGFDLFLPIVSTRADALSGF